jgi:malate synthase
MSTAAAVAARGLTVDPALERFVEDELLPGLGIAPADYWSALRSLVEEFAPENRELLGFRDQLQATVDRWHRQHRGEPWDAVEYRAFLEEIGYIEPRGPRFRIQTENVDSEIAAVSGPQLVVPVSNARFALNAANARWGSLYDALYGSDVIPESGGCERGSRYNPVRGAAVIAYVAKFLDGAVPLARGSHARVIEYRLATAYRRASLQVTLDDGSVSGLADPGQLIGHNSNGDRRGILLRNHGLHIEIGIDRGHPVGAASAAGVSDVVLESAVTTIQDFEDSVAAVDAADKVAAYRNWLGLMRGTLTATFPKDGREQTRRLEPDRRYMSSTGDNLVLPGRSLLLVRNVGHLLTTPAVLTSAGSEVFEGILDALITATCALYDLRGLGEFTNSRTGSIYIVKPKMHGSREVAFADRLFARVEDVLHLPRHTLKIGVMDEERRTSVNLEECIRRVSKRLVFINTGFLDRTGDEIHTSMEAGPMQRKNDIRREPWLTAYENRNVRIGIRCGLPGRAQIGKGMWPMPDRMRDMLETKQAHPEAGANCAWVPSPTAATLHALHYHAVDVAGIQNGMSGEGEDDLDAMLLPPLAHDAPWSPAQVQQELDNNAQGILGYVVRWIDQGVGCSKVPDIDGVGLMEDRATLRISSQHIANWLRHGVCTEKQVIDTFERMAEVVDEQNRDDPAYERMAPACDGLAFRAACDLVLKGREQPNGYTEPLLHDYRRQRKA